MSSCFEIMADHELNEGQFLTELSQRLAHSTKRIRAISDSQLPDDPWRPNYEETNRSWNIPTSPQSILCNAMGGYHSNQASPPCEEVMNKNMEATELLCAAAEKVTRLRQHTGTGTAFFHSCAHPQKPCTNQPFKQQQSMKKKQKGYVQYTQQAQQDKTRSGDSTGRTPGLSPSAWPSLKKSQFQGKQTPPGSGMRAVILGNQVTKSERSGTGVFLPRQAGSWNNPSPEIGRKMPVLLPERVVQALNLNLGAIETPHQLNKNGFFLEQYDAASKHRGNVVSAHAEQRRDMARSKVMNKELQLPQEWTY